VLAGAWAAIRSGRTPLTSLFASGLWIVMCVSAPLIFASSASRFHLVALGAIVALAGAIGLARAALPRARSWWAPAGATVVVVLLGTVARPEATAATCSDAILWSDTQVLADWPQVPAHIKGWLADKPQACARGAIGTLTSSLDVVAWVVDDDAGTVDHESVTGGVGTRVVALVTRQARGLTLEVRAADSRRPLHVLVAGSGTAAQSLVAGEAWQPVTVPLSSGWRTRLRDMRRVDLTIAGDVPGGRLEVRGLQALR
jgi:hypothetical protein